MEIRAAEAPPPATVVADVDVSLFSVDHPEQFPLTAAVAYSAAPKLVVTGTVNPDISATFPSSRWPLDAWSRFTRASETRSRRDSCC